MTAVELLESRNPLHEHERIEAKRAFDAGKSILETICAFANEPGLGGGWIALGVVREEMALFPFYEVEGIEQPDKLSADIASQSATYYVPTERLATGEEGLSGKSQEGLSTNPPTLSTNPDGLYAKPVEEEENRRKALLDELPGALAAKIDAIGQRNPPGEACEVIVEVCRLRAWQAEELAALVRRHSRYVRNNYLRPPMREGRLVMTNPDEPNDPQQAYRAVSDAKKHEQEDGA